MHSDNQRSPFHYPSVVISSHPETWLLIGTHGSPSHVWSSHTLWWMCLTLPKPPPIRHALKDVGDFGDRCTWYSYLLHEMPSLFILHHGNLYSMRQRKKKKSHLALFKMLRLSAATWKCRRCSRWNAIKACTLKEEEGDSNDWSSLHQQDSFWEIVLPRSWSCSYQTWSCPSSAGGVNGEDNKTTD